MEHTTRIAEGSYNRQSQQTSAIPSPTAPFFHSWRVLANIGKWAIVRQGEPTIVVAVFQYIARVHGTHHKHSRRQLQPPITTNISHTYRPTAPFFPSWRVLSNIGKWAIVRQGEPTIVVAVFQYIARVNGTHHKHSRRQLQPPITKITSHTYRPTAPFFPSWRVLANIGKWAIVRQGEPTIVVAVFQYIARVHGTHHKHSRRQLQPPITTNISHTYRPTAPFFPSWRVLANIGKWAIVRQGEPTIVVAVFQYIARVHGTHHKHSRRQLQPPITTNISHTYRPTAPFFPSWRVLANIGKWAIVRQGEPTIVVAVFQYIARVHGTHHKHSRRQLQPPITTNISHTYRPTAPFFPSWRVLANIDKWAIVRQEQPTIVVAVFQYIARVHGTHHKHSRRQLQPPITTNISHTYRPTAPFFPSWRVLANIGKWAIVRQ